MSLELITSELREELENERRDSKKAYHLNCLTREAVEEVFEMQPTEDYVKNHVIPLFEEAAKIIKTSSTKGGFAKYIAGFIDNIKERINCLEEYKPILKGILAC
jgi:hypothetical protein